MTYYKKTPPKFLIGSREFFRSPSDNLVKYEDLVAIKDRYVFKIKGKKGKYMNFISIINQFNSIFFFAM